MEVLRYHWILGSRVLSFSMFLTCLLCGYMKTVRLNEQESLRQSAWHKWEALRWSWRTANSCILGGHASAFLVSAL